MAPDVVPTLEPFVGVEELIARDAEEYVEIALRVARDRAYRETLSSRIGEGLPQLADRSEPIEALAAAFERMVSRGPMHGHRMVV